MQACGRVLAKDMIAGFDNPPFDRSPVDGYACKAEDIMDASESHPVQLTVLEEIDAGQYSRVTVEKGQAVRIMTGAAIPKGCDCCVRQEDTDYGEETVRIFRPTGQWQNYCYQGENFKNGTVLLKKGDKIGFIEAGILASMGVIKVKVYRRVRAAVLTIGDEVMAPGKRLIPGKIKVFNVVQNLIPKSQMLSIQAGTTVVLVFDTDVSQTSNLKKNLELLTRYCGKLKIIFSTSFEFGG